MKYVWFYENSLHCSDFSHPFSRWVGTVTAQIAQGWLLRITDGWDELASPYRSQSRILILFVKSIGKMYRSRFRLLCFLLGMRHILRPATPRGCVCGARSVPSPEPRALHFLGVRILTLRCHQHVGHCQEKWPAGCQREASCSDMNFSANLLRFGRFI